MEVEMTSPHPLVTQLRFARSELVRCLEGLSEADARRRLARSSLPQREEAFRIERVGRPSGIFSTRALL
jgi:hypothetical protein